MTQVIGIETNRDSGRIIVIFNLSQPLSESCKDKILECFRLALAEELANICWTTSNRLRFCIKTNTRDGNLNFMAVQQHLEQVATRVHKQ